MKVEVFDIEFESLEVVEGTKVWRVREELAFFIVCKQRIKRR